MADNLQGFKSSRSFSAKFLSIACAFALINALIPLHHASALDNTDTGLPVYRLYLESNNGEHLYTTDANEAMHLSTNAGWVYEGVGWFAPQSGEPVYRLNNDGLRNHLYTTDANEIRFLTTQDEWKLDNGGKPLFYSGGNVGIYRLYNAGLAGMHLLTTDGNEYRSLPPYGWQQEGVPVHAVQGAVDASLWPIGSLAGQDVPNETGKDISNVDSWYSAEATVNLAGAGSGYHAKLTLLTPQSAVSFGLQYDQHAVAPYTGKTAFLVENVDNNSAGGQQYIRAKKLAELNKEYRLLLAWNKDGSFKAYVDGTLVCMGVNNSLKRQIAEGGKMYIRTEGAARLNGDSVKADFSDIKLKGRGVYSPSAIFNPTDIFVTDNGIKVDYSDYATNRISVIQGTLKGLNAGKDWDSEFEKATSVIQYSEPGV